MGDAGDSDERSSWKDVDTTLAPFADDGGGSTLGEGASEGDEIRVSEVLASLSFALDVTEGQPEGHAVRNALIGMRLAEEVGLSGQQSSALFYALLLKDLGCSSNAAKMCYLFGSDDRAVKRDVKTRDWSSLTGAISYVAKNVARNGSVPEKIAGFVKLGLEGPEAARDLVRIRCEQGAGIARMLGFPEPTCRAIHQLDEHWNGDGHPEGREGEQISPLARILGLSQTVEVFHREFDLRTACEMAEERRRTWFDPDLVDALHSIRDDREFWATVAVRDPRSQLRRWEPDDRAVPATGDRLDLISRAFARVVDAKSPWTYRHSERVGELATETGRRLGIGEQGLRKIHRAALLHDIGKLGVSNMILDKEGELTDEEYAEMKRHPRTSQRILRRVSPFREVAEIAGRHHERLDGTGYHRGLDADSLSLASRTLAVADVYEALTADRPYRDPFSPGEAMEILRDDAGTALDADAVSALEQAVADASHLARGQQGPQSPAAGNRG